MILFVVFRLLVVFINFVFKKLNWFLFKFVVFMFIEFIVMKMVNLYIVNNLMFECIEFFFVLMCFIKWFYEI